MLTRAKRLQVLVECGWGGLFWGLMVSCAAVLAIRTGALAYSAGSAVGWILGLTLTGAAMVAWRRRPSDLEVAILADLHLNLQQKLSTAWEFVRAGCEAALAERLSAQAIKARLPSRPEFVFPLRINIWGKLTPIAASLLALVSILDLQRTVEPTVALVDEIVAREGVRLREYGHRMEGRARRGELPRSARESQRLQRLGARMGSGMLARREALEDLRQMGAALDEQRRSALGEGIETRVGALGIEALEVSPDAPGSRLRLTLRDLLDGRLEPGDVRPSGEDAETLARLGVSREALERALERFSAGEDRDLRRIQDMLEGIDRSLREADELARAEREVRRTRGSLGEAGVSDGHDGERPRAASAEEGAMDSLAGADLAGDDAGEGGGFTPGRDPGHHSDEAGSGRAPSPGRADEPGGAVLKPESQLREGRVLTFEAKALPRAGRPTVEAVELDARFSHQVEEVLSKEEYPLHRKEFIRRYFLGLSEGKAVEGRRR